jgi:hypothetical protein
MPGCSRPPFPLLGQVPGLLEGSAGVGCGWVPGLPNLARHASGEDTEPNAVAGIRKTLKTPASLWTCRYRGSPGPGSGEGSNHENA